MTSRTVKVSNASLSATAQDILEFFSFSGEIENVELKSGNERSQIAFVTFKEVHGAETAVLLSGATIVDQPITITLEPNYSLPTEALASSDASENKSEGESTESAAQKAEEVVSSMLAKGFILGQDAVNKAKAFDEKHQVVSTASAKVAMLDQKIGLSEKISIVNEKVKDVDNKYQVSEKTKSALVAAEQTVSTAGSTVMKNRYILTGASWVTSAFQRVAKAAGDVGQKTMEKMSEEQERRQAENVPQSKGSVSPPKPTDTTAHDAKSTTSIAIANDDKATTSITTANDGKSPKATTSITIANDGKSPKATTSITIANDDKSPKATTSTTTANDDKLPKIATPSNAATTTNDEKPSAVVSATTAAAKEEKLVH